MKSGNSLLFCAVLFPRILFAQLVTVNNPSFEDSHGAAAPGWTLFSAQGGASESRPYQGSRSLWIKGDGAQSSSGWWHSMPLEVEPGKAYILSFYSRRDLSSLDGHALSGTNQFNVNLKDLTERWQPYRLVVYAPQTSESNQLRFGQFASKDRFFFDAVRLAPAQAAHRRYGMVELGLGERIIGDHYNFAPPMAEHHTIYFRPLRCFSGRFDTDRCFFADNSRLEFEHSIAEHTIRSADLYLWTAHQGTGELLVEVCKDNRRWISLGFAEPGQKKAVALPDSLFPAKSLCIRMSASTQSDAAIVLSGYRLEAVLDGEPVNGSGDTRYFEVQRAEPGVELAVDCPGLFDPSQARKGITLKAMKQGREVSGDLRVLDNGRELARGKLGATTNSPAGAGARDLVLESRVATLMVPIDIPEYFNNDYGELLDGSGVLCASSGWKIPKSRELPARKAKALVVELARNEAEAVQLIMHPSRPIKDFTLSVGHLQNQAGEMLAPESVQILQVAYVPVSLPTDPSGVAALWPDPLPPLTAPLTLTANENQPFWIRVKTTANTTPGLYQGTIRLAGRDYQKQIPFSVRVFRFSLPERMTCTTALGCNVERAFEYHGLVVEQDKRKVLDLYLQALSDHRITPFNPAPLDAFQVTWPDVKPGDQPIPEDLSVRIDWTRWDQAMQKAYDDYHITSFLLPIQGMGGGTFYSRTEPSLLGFGEETAVYQTLFKNYCKTVQDHLKEKGWLQDAYVYWFDEPDPKDYPFVMNGFNRIKAAAPDLPRMLTEEIQQELLGGPNIWCPLSPELKPEKTRERQKHGEKIWWYVCTGPKAPYATLFIDHPATELRVWLWQTWEREVQGILIWETLLWTSPTAYPNPNAPQNPYQDPMGWEYGYGGEPGMRRPWGNGDGRFLYPPLAAADGRPSAPIFDPPVDCIRIEMLRDGIEDYEYLSMLRKALAAEGMGISIEQRRSYKKLLQVPVEISASMTQFTKDPKPIELHRRKVAAALEALH